MTELRYVMRPFVLGQLHDETLAEMRQVLQYKPNPLSDWQDVPTVEEDPRKQAPVDLTREQERLGLYDEVSACTCPSGDGSLRWPCPAHPQAVAGLTDEPWFRLFARMYQAYEDANPADVRKDVAAAGRQWIADQATLQNKGEK